MGGSSRQVSKGGGGSFHFITAAFFAMTVTAAIYLDLPVDKYNGMTTFPPS